MIQADIKTTLSEKITFIPCDERKSMALVGPIDLPIVINKRAVMFHWYTWCGIETKNSNVETFIRDLPDISHADQSISSALVYGDFAEEEHALVRLHSICHTGDIFGSQRCDCGYQLKTALEQIFSYGCGALMYLANQEGRGIGLVGKSLTYLLQQHGYDTVDANTVLGFKDDARNYEQAAQVINTLRKKPISLLTNNPLKVLSLQSYGVAVDKRISLWGGKTSFNEDYLQTKVYRMGHISAAPSRAEGIQNLVR